MRTHQAVLDSFLEDLSEVIPQILDADVCKYDRAGEEHFGLIIAHLFKKHCEALSDYRYIFNFFEIKDQDKILSLNSLSSYSLPAFYEKFRNEGGGHVLLQRIILDLVQIDIESTISNPNFGL